MNKLYNVITSYCVNTLHSHWKTRAPCSLESFNQGFYRGNKGYFYPIALQSHSCFLHFSSPRSHCFNYPSPFPVNRPSLYSTVPPFLLFPLSVYINLLSLPPLPHFRPSIGVEKNGKNEVGLDWRHKLLLEIKAPFIDFLPFFSMVNSHSGFLVPLNWMVVWWK